MPTGSKVWWKGVRKQQPLLQEYSSAMLACLSLSRKSLFLLEQLSQHSNTCTSVCVDGKEPICPLGQLRGTTGRHLKQVPQEKRGVYFCMSSGTLLKTHFPIRGKCARKFPCDDVYLGGPISLGTIPLQRGPAWKSHFSYNRCWGSVQMS